MSNNNLGLYIGIGVASVVAIGGGGYYLASRPKRRDSIGSEPNRSSFDIYQDQYRGQTQDVWDQHQGGKRKRKTTLKKRGKK